MGITNLNSNSYSMINILSRYILINPPYSCIINSFRSFYISSVPINFNISFRRLYFNMYQFALLLFIFIATIGSIQGKCVDCRYSYYGEGVECCGCPDSATYANCYSDHSCYCYSSSDKDRSTGRYLCSHISLLLVLV